LSRRKSRDFSLGELRAGVPFLRWRLPAKAVHHGRSDAFYDAQAVALETDEQALAQRVVQCAGRALSLSITAGKRQRSRVGV
jgi:hypothetical protein